MASFRYSLLFGTVSAVALASAAYAQQTAATVSGGGETVVVTGSRIVANGYQAPTPVTTVTATDLIRNTPESISAGLQQLPQFAATTGSNATSSQAGTPSAGNYLNLRDLGPKENLILLDGARLPATSFDGTVDTNIIPQAFIQRVDVVTGGASAAYGSDAVSGVVNFILDNKYSGLKGQIQGGVSTFGDDAQLKLSLAGGTELFGGRGHIEASYDHFQQPGIECERKTAGDCDRPFAFGHMLTGAGTQTNPYTPTNNASINNATFGTLITSAMNASGQKVPFSYTGFQFANDGSIAPFNPGTPTGTSNISTNGQGAYSYGTTLTSALRTDQGYTRFDYDITPDISAYVSGIYSESQTRYVTVATGTQFNAFHIFQDNAFLPTDVANAMAAQGVAYFTGSRVEADQTPKLVRTGTDVWIGRAGLKGAIGDNWKWSVDFSHGDSQLRTDHFGNFIQSSWFPALDAVRSPTTGAVVCRSSITNPGLNPGCTPWNPFGVGAPSSASYNYVQGVSQFQVHNRQDNFSGQISGGLFDLPAGTVNVATGFEYRYQQLKETSNNDPSQPIDQTGFCHAVNANGAPTGAPVTSAQCNAVAGNGIVNVSTTPFLLTYNSTNVGHATGDESIEEGFAEFSVPLLKDLPFAEDVDADLAYRFAQYSVSGSATTWKVGLNYQPIDELRFRTNMSRDFRAPTLYELFAGTSATRGLFNDAVHSGVQDNSITLTQGNPNLKPEIGNTTTVGAVWSPAYIEGFTASLDYYAIKIDNEITQLSTTVLDQNCESSGGSSPLCQYITRPTSFSDHSAASFPTSITSIPLNQAFLTMNGWDLDMSYNLPLDNIFSNATSSLNFRFIGNYTPNYTTNAGNGAKSVQAAGLNGEGSNSSLVMPKTKFNLTANYVDGPLTVGGRMRYIGSTRYTNDSTIVYTDNTIGSVAYVDLNASYNFGAEGHAFTAYTGINNLFNKFVFVPNTGQPEEFYPTQQSLYDVVGRYFTLGIKFNY